MKKKLWYGIIAGVVSVAVLVSGAKLSVADDAVSGNALVSENGFKEFKTSDRLQPLGVVWSEYLKTYKKSDSVPLTLTNVLYNQTYCREEAYPALTAYRADKDNWWIYKSGGVYTEENKLYFDMTSELVYDYELEKCAMNRAAMLIARYDHFCPDGPSYQWGYVGTAYDNNGGAGECIMVTGFNLTGEQLIDIFMEENGENNQGHRRVLLTVSATGEYRPSITRVGIAKVTYNNRNFYVFETSSPVVGGDLTSAPDRDGAVSVTYDVSPSICRPEVWISGWDNGMQVREGETEDIPGANLTFVIDVDTFSEITNEDMPITWSSKDTSIAAIEDGKVVGKSVGTTTLVAYNEYFDVMAELPVKVLAKRASGTEPTGPSEPETPVTPTQPVTPVNPAPSTPSVPVTPTQPEVKRKAQKIKVSSKASKVVTIKRSKVKKKAQTFNISAKTTGNSKITYKVTKYPKGAKKYITVSKKGKVTLKKGAKKGTYKVRVTAAQTSKYAKATRTITIKVK